MNIWALADLHLAFAVPSKSMEIFGPRWQRYTDKIANKWQEVVKKDDLVLLAGDISWAKRLEEAITDLQWIDSLPGTKVLLRGNHDYWWSSLNKMGKILPSSLHAIHNNSFYWNDVTIGGSRLWDTSEYNFDEFLEGVGETGGNEDEETEEAEKIFKRELQRLELSLQSLNSKASLRIAMTHYPPIGANLAPSQASVILEKYKINICVFGHLHNVRYNALPFGEKNGIRYCLTAGDYLDFAPLKIR